ncbi:hypothetical protein K7X08_020001 [Anisodus acutangulus]|uniref:Uncharacterized protein n=1 Tax=Anisodus acutangulus TaxID=402998 RepID=A0A9Q1RMI4_9SOLA|nr:hypothetical protein K7X08_020001 [Anisodus acutangulus]
MLSSTTSMGPITRLLIVSVMEVRMHPFLIFNNYHLSSLTTYRLMEMVQFQQNLQRLMGLMQKLGLESLGITEESSVTAMCFRVVKHWLRADHDPYYNPINDYVILPTAFDIARHQEKGLDVTSVREEWEIVSESQDGEENAASGKP